MPGYGSIAMSADFAKDNETAIATGQTILRASGAKAN
jgi:hypothetical protein